MYLAFSLLFIPVIQDGEEFPTTPWLTGRDPLQRLFRLCTFIFLIVYPMFFLFLYNKEIINKRTHIPGRRPNSKHSTL